MSAPITLANGRYLLVKPIGEGGMASVYRAFDQRLQVWRAIKLLNPELASKPRIRQRFENEAQTMALLEHRHIVRVYDVGTDGQHCFIVMELVSGGCLVDWLEEHGPMPPRMAVDAILQVCEGIHAAHTKGIIHRDIKPHNVLVTADGVCRVTDFGIARLGDQDQNMTKTGAVMGTWGYMAPEQRMNAKGVDPRADIYALASTLYSLLTNKTPMDLFAADRDGSMLDGIPDPLKAILVKGSEYRREDRYGSVPELAEALRGVNAELPELVEGAPPLAKDPGPPPPPPNPQDFVKVRAAATDMHLETSVPPDDGATMLPDEPTGQGPLPPQPAAPPTAGTLVPGGAGTSVPTGQTLVPGGLQGAVTMAPGDGPQLPHVGGQRAPTWRPGEATDPRGVPTGQYPAGQYPFPPGTDPRLSLPPTDSHGHAAPRGGGGLAGWILAGGLAFVGLCLLVVAGAIIAAGPFGKSSAVAPAPVVAEAVPVAPTVQAPPPADPTEAAPNEAAPVAPVAPTAPTALVVPTAPVPVATKTTTKTTTTKVTTPRVTQESAIVTPPPADPPASDQCVKVTPPGRVAVGVDAVFKASLCAEDGSSVTLWYRAPEGSWRSIEMRKLLGSYNAKVPVDGSFSGGMEYYVLAGDASFGSRSDPKVVSN